MSGERLAVMILTAHRLDYAVQTARALSANLKHDGPTYWHIADDGDDDNYIGAVADAIVEGSHNGWRTETVNADGRSFVPTNPVTGANITASNAGGNGYGASFNLASQTVHTVADYVLPVEDDWVLQRPLDTTAIVRMLERGGVQSKDEWAWAVPPPEWFVARSVRLGYLGLKWPLSGHVFKTDEELWMALDPDSLEQNVQAGHPRIETVEYQRAVGPWAEGLNPGATELDWVQRPEARRGVVWPLSTVDVRGNVFGHIGAVSSYHA